MNLISNYKILFIKHTIISIYNYINIYIYCYIKLPIVTPIFHSESFFIQFNHCIQIEYCNNTLSFPRTEGTMDKFPTPLPYSTPLHLPVFYFFYFIPSGYIYKWFCVSTHRYRFIDVGKIQFCLTTKNISLAFTNINYRFKNIKNI